MGSRIKPIIILSMLIVSIFFLNYNSEIKAINSEQETTSSSNYSINSRSNENFTWGPFLAISEPIFGQNNSIGNNAQPTNIVVEGDKIYVVWPDENDTNGAGTDLDIFFRFFNGSAWGDIQVISEPMSGQNLNTGNSNRPRIAVEKGTIYVIWWDQTNTNNAGTDRDVFFRCNRTGNGWEDIQVISEPVPGQNINKDPRGNVGDIAVENGNIYVVWADGNDTNGAGTDRDVFYRCNLTGTHWEPVQVISEPILGQNLNTADYGVKPKIEVEDRKIYVVWPETYETNGAGKDADIFYRTNLTGLGWEDMQIISEPIPGKDTNKGESFDTYFEVENDEIYVIWQDSNNTNGAGGDYDIFYRCNITGFGWEPVQVISEPVFGQNNNTGISKLYGGGIAVENGNIHVVWNDDNDTNGSGRNWDIHYRCNLSGEGWETIKVVSEPIEGNDTNGNCQDPDIDVYKGKAHIIWNHWGDLAGQNSGDDVDVFYRWVQTPIETLFLSSPKVTPNSGNTSTEFNFTVQYSHSFNSSPTEILVFIDGIEHTMLNVDPLDTDYTNGTKYFFKVKNLEIGDHNYSFSVTSETKTITTSLRNYPKVINTPPRIIIQDNLIAIEDTYYEVRYEFEDMDVGNVGQLVTWNFSTNASWLKFNLITALLNGTPVNDDVGTYWINISINDTIDMDFTNFTLPVIEVNDNPIINTTNIDIIYEDEPYMVDYNATDIDSPLDFHIWNLETDGSSWLKINLSTGILNGTPTNSEVGNYWVNISVLDSEGGIDFTNFTLTVLNVNDPPVIITQDILETPIDELFEVDYNATDIDSPQTQLGWSLKTNANWLTIDSSSGLLNGTPTISDFGTYDVNVSVFDGDGGSDHHAFNLVVTGENKPPTILTIDVVSAVINELYYVDYEAFDDHTPADQLVWSLNTNADWLEIDAHTGELIGIPKSSDVGLNLVIVTVNDTEGNFDFNNFSLNVYTTKNTPPKIITEDILLAEVNVLYYVSYRATDDRTLVEHLEWYLQTNASWLNFNSKTGVISGTPSSSDIGFNFVNISVTDDENGRDYHNFTLLVMEELFENAPPILSNSKMSPDIGDTTTEFTFSVHYYDEDSDVPVFIQLVTEIDNYDMKLKTGETTNGFYECIIKLPEGEHTYYFTTSDGFHIVNSEQFSTLYIKKVKQAPEKESSTGLILIAIIPFIIVLLILFILIRRKRKSQEEILKKESALSIPITKPVPTSPTTTYPTKQPVQPRTDTTPTISPSVIPIISQPEKPAQPIIIEQPKQHPIEVHKKNHEND